MKLNRKKLFARLPIVSALLAGAMVYAQTTNDAANAAARASLERIQALRKERPGDVVVVFFQALTHINLGERDAAFELLGSLKGRKLGLIPVRGLGFDAVFLCDALSAGRDH